MKKQVAEQICQKLEAIIGQMNGLNNFLIANGDEGDRKRIQPVLAMCVTELDIEILVPIHREFPEFKPGFLP